jgi:hypothetical protein
LLNRASTCRFLDSERLLPAFHMSQRAYKMSELQCVEPAPTGRRKGASLLPEIVAQWLSRQLRQIRPMALRRNLLAPRTPETSQRKNYRNGRAQTQNDDR